MALFHPSMILPWRGRSTKLGGGAARGEAVDIARVEVQQKTVAAQALNAYTGSWNSWATGERPRRLTIGLYGDLFTLMHQMEAEQTSKPQELIWGIGISSWLLQTEKASAAFEYPLLTQAMELLIEDRSMAIEIRPRATDTQIELDAFVACQVSGTIEASGQYESRVRQLRVPAGASEMTNAPAYHKDSPRQNPRVAIQCSKSLRCCCVVCSGGWLRLEQEPCPVCLAREECRIGHGTVDHKANCLVDCETL
jgi:hypothetical protein